MARSRIVGAAAAALSLPLLLLVPLPSANAESKTAAPAAAQAAPGQANDIRELTRKDFTFEGKPVDAATSYQPSAVAARSFAAAATPAGRHRPRDGSALDDFNGRHLPKDYTLRGVGQTRSRSGSPTTSRSRRVTVATRCQLDRRSPTHR